MAAACASATRSNLRLAILVVYCIPDLFIPSVPAGEQRLINLKCRATIGAVSNPQNKNRVLGKAGANRWRGRRPTVSG
jgi:ribosomal protein L2